MKLKRLFLGSFLLMFLVLQLLSVQMLFAPAKASALDVPADQVTVTARFTSAARIVLTTSYNGQTAEIIYRDEDPLDTSLNYRAQDPHQCPAGDLNLYDPQNWQESGETRNTPKLFSLLGESGNPKGDVDVDVLSSANGACANIGSGGSKIEVTVTDESNAYSYMAYKDYHTIARVFRDGDWTFVRDTNDPTVFYRNGEGAGTQCRDFIKVAGDGQRATTYAIDVGEPRTNQSGVEIAGPDMPDGCNYDTSNDRLYDIGGSANSEQWNISRSQFAVRTTPLVGTQHIQNVDPNNPPPSSVGDSESNEDNSCESKSGAMGWILCPVINLIDGGLNWVDEQVGNLLAVDNNKFNDSGLEQSWKITRNLAYLILVPVVLVMVIGTALGFEFISAYTVKRALPRLIIATVFIALSWTIVTFLVGFSNNVGAGVQGIMESPFRARFGESCQDQLNLACFFDVEPGFENGILHGILFLPQAAASIVGLIIFLILFGATILTSVVIGFFVLLIRQMFILALMVLAPLAILAWIFPGNDKLWKSWWSLFTKLLIMYPLIMGLISTGRIFAAILKETAQSGGSGLDGGILNPVMRLAAYMLPYALIPLTFKFAGGTFAMVAGFADDKTKGLFDKQRAKRAERWGDYKSTGALPGFRGTNVAARGMQRVGRGIGAGYKGRLGFGAAGAAVGDSNVANAAADFMKSAEFNAQRDNDPVLRAAAVGRTEAEAVRNLQRIYGMSEADAKTTARQTKATIGFGAKQQLASAQQLALTGTGYESMQQMVETLALASGGNAGTASRLAGFANAISKDKGRHDLAPGFGNLNTLVQRQAGVDPGGRAAPTEAEFASATVAAARGSGDNVTLLRDKTPGLRNLAQSLETELQTSVAAVNDPSLSQAQRAQALESMKRTVAHIRQIDGDRGFASQDNQMVINELAEGTRFLQSQAEQIISAQPNAAEHMADIERFSAPRTGSPNDPRFQAGGGPPPAADE